ncbi:MAG TPA: hypothetical protein VFE50_21340 [Cyclobacteriaceae bacterium]|nr:hypothetical protein [Cyclobacteriaceae bacterium]
MKFTLTPELLTPFIISNALATGILWLSFRKPNVAEGILGMLFFGAAGFNIYTAFSNPSAYQGFADTTFLPLYSEFIRGFFARQTTVVVSAIAIGQLYIGTSMLLENLRFKLGCIAGLIFGVAIAPLGIGAAFPSTIILSLSFLVLLLKKETSHTLT